MDLKLLIFGTLVLAAPCCVFYAGRHWIYWRFITNGMVYAITLIWYHKHRKTQDTREPIYSQTHMNIYWQHLLCGHCSYRARQIARTVTSVHATCTQRAHKEFFGCTKLRARKSVKTLSSWTRMLFKVASCFCVWKQIIFGTTKSDIHSFFQLRRCC